MRKTAKAVPMSELSPIITGLIAEGVDVTLIVTGNSMRPMLSHLKDTVVLTKCNPEALKKGDIPLYRRDDGKYILHRIIKVHDSCFDTVGDHQYEVEHGVKKQSVICVVKGFTRKGKCHSCDSFGYKLYVRLWRLTLPFRKPLLKLHTAVYRLFNKKH